MFLTIRGLVVMDVELGRFGDLRLQKGGSFCRRGWLRWDAAACVCGGLAGIERAKSG